MADEGMVYLVGAGPGDPGLLTLRGKECLELADVVVYDQLANREFLALARPATELIYVGKQAGQHTLRQEEINALLVAKGRQGKVVVRLKGGDPYVFGRGGEETWELQQAGIRFEVVPGVTSGIAAPAYAGIPVTHRDCNAVFSLVTGHEDPGKTESTVDWEALARGGGTIAFYMGVGNLPGIVDKLVRGGRPATTPLAVIRCRTQPTPQDVEGTLASIVEQVGAVGLKPPAITLVGEVVRLRRHLQWFERRPLFGRRIVVTRSRPEASDFARRLRELGAHVLLFPTIRIEAPEDDTPIREAAQKLAAFDWVLFASVHSVDRLFAGIEACGGDARWLAPCRLAAVGTATAERLRQKGVRPDLLPSRFTADGLLEALRQADQIDGRRFLLPRADLAASHLPDGLRSAGATVREVVAYRTVPADPDPEILAALRDGEVDMVTFTSSSTARNYAAVVRAALGHLPAGIVYGSMGPETSATATAEGMPPAFEAEPHTVAGLVAAIGNYFKDRNP